MAFSNSFPSIHMTSSSRNELEGVQNEQDDIVQGMSVGRQQTDREYKWSSIPTNNTLTTTTTTATTTSTETRQEEELQLCSFEGIEEYQSNQLPDKDLDLDFREGRFVQDGKRASVEGGSSTVSKSHGDSQSTSGQGEGKKDFIFESLSPLTLSMEVEQEKDCGDGKRCDLIAELVENQNEIGIGRELPIDQMAASMMSSYDDNGNPLSLEEQGLVNANEMNGFLEVVKAAGAEGFVNVDQQQQKEQEQQNEQLVTSAGSLGGLKSGSESNSNKQSMHENIENPIKFGFKSTLQKSVEGFIDEPKYFINAADLDLENYTLPSLTSDPGDDDIGDNLSKVNKDKTKINTNDNNSKNTLNQTASRLPTIIVKPRVPMSKSFPDIIQTTFVDDRNHRDDFTNAKKLIHADTMKEKESSFNNLADSLEDINTTDSMTDFEHAFKIQQHRQMEQQKHCEKFQADFQTNNHKLDDIMNNSQISQSQIGILSERPPEAWVIDFNSLSMESENFDNNSEMSSSIKSSNPNSLAFFIDMDENSTASESTVTRKKSTDLKSPDKKKIFSMFVDFASQPEAPSEKKTAIQLPSNPIAPPLPHHPGNKPSRLPVHRNVMTVIKDGEPLQFPSSQSQSHHHHSGSGGQGKGVSSIVNKKCNFQYPSPILQHKAAAEAARKTVAKIEMLESESSKADTANKLLAFKECKNEQQENVGDSVATSCNSNMDASMTSNRSSLHVATSDFDMMNFSSSFISSMETSAPEEEICSKGPCFKLGKDLLRMFEDGINTDVKICVNGRYLRAHKCILSSRSQYFAAIFSGPWIEKAGNTIPLNGFSYNVVHFTMCHIYSGTNEIPDTIDLLELATLTDLLGLEGLRENISQTIRVKFCHNFHRPCTGCIQGVLECYPLACSYEMDELHRKMTKWICKHFVRIWPTKAFANLGDELIEKCLRYSVNHLSVDNILDHTLGCDQLLTTMPSVRWTEPIFSVVNQMSEACVQFIGENFSQVIQCQRFLLFGKGQQWNISRIEGTFGDAMLLMKPDEACLSHSALSRVIELGTETIDEVEWSTMFVDFLKMLAKEIERYLTANAQKAVLSKYWEQLGQDVRKRICTTSFLGYDKAGNKIVKGNTSTSGGKTTSGQGRLTPSERSSSISSIKSNASSTTKTSSSRHGDQNKSSNYNQTNNHSTKTKTIASVRPMQNVQPTSTTSVESRAITQTTSSGSSKSKNSKSNRSQQNSTRPSKTVTVDLGKEKSFTNSPRNSVASTTASASRTPMNPLTPMTPSKPGLPSLVSTVNTKTTTSRMVKHHNAANVISTPSAVPPKSTFVTNSARANAVSKPNLRQKNVLSTVSSARNATTTTTTTTPRTPNLSQPSRYASSLGAGRNSRASLSGEEKMEKVTSLPNSSVETIKVRSSRSSVTSTTISHGKKSNNRNFDGSSANTSNSSSRKTSAKTSGGCSSGGVVEQYMEPMRDSNVMSKSTIETDSGETKMRTLAEIGRSSTFSKDEPTILGKLDHSQTLSIDFS